MAKRKEEKKFFADGIYNACPELNYPLTTDREI
jgi:hypothetical protein